ncbi:MAG: linear amide C-N hydrolase [Anaerolineae bacterium]|nr:linear amide C-N hydrolase [Anaerolineae bacterium]
MTKRHICLNLLLFLWLTACAAPISPTLTPDLDPVTQTLTSLKRIGDHPLYVMHYVGDYPDAPRQSQAAQSAWGCSLFAALGNPKNMVYGRNFDWEHSPALVLYTAPGDGYAAISLVNLGFLGFDKDAAENLLTLPRTQQEALLQTPFVPIDGMNEEGLVVGMAAVNNSWHNPDSTKPTIGSLAIMRELLDHAKTVDEAVALFEQYNIDFTGGPPIHYLVADATGDAVLVEFVQGERIIIRNEHPWHAATNFLLATAGDDPCNACYRYKAIDESLQLAEGCLNTADALALLQTVSQPDSTQWSAVYDLSDKIVNITLDRIETQVYTFTFDNH